MSSTVSNWSDSCSVDQSREAEAEDATMSLRWQRLKETKDQICKEARRGAGLGTREH